ncbi:MAG: acyl-CoA dehydrogenase [Candidatus Latescibacterota bacterium]
MKEQIEAFLQSHFSAVDRHTPYGDDLLREFLLLGPLHYFIPTALGGRCDRTESYLELVESTSYWSVPLGLTLGIAGSLFLRPLAKFARPEVRDPVLREFLDSPALGGIMITEPTGGTDIFALRTAYTEEGGRLHLQGTKCWAGLTGKAGHWLVAARLQRGDQLTKRLNLIYVPLASPGVAVHAYFDALGLRPIPYGETRYDGTVVPSSHLVSSPGQTGLRVIYDTLFRTRLGMPAIAAGLCRRLTHEAGLRLEQRSSFGITLARYDQVRFRMETLQGLYELNHRLWRFGGAWMNAHDEVTTDYTLVNAAKVVSSEAMQAAADSALQLFASAAYKGNHLVGRAFVDSRPFQIFEGANDVLDENTYEAILGLHGRFDGAVLAEEFERYGLELPTDLPAEAMQLLDARGERSQRQKVQVGRLISWAFVLAMLRREGATNEAVPLQAPRVAVRRIAELAAGAPYLD